MEKIMTTKQGISSHIAFAYLDGLRNNAVDLFDDAEYSRLFYALKSRVSDMFDLPYDGEIIDEYVIVEQRVENQK